MNRYFDRLADLTALHPAHPLGKTDSSPKKSGVVRIEQESPQPIHQEETRLVEPARSPDSSFGKPLEPEPASQETASEKIPTGEQSGESSTADSEPGAAAAKTGPVVQPDSSVGAIEITERVEIAGEKTARPSKGVRKGSDESSLVEAPGQTDLDGKPPAEEKGGDHTLKKEVLDGKPSAGDLPNDPQPLEEHILRIPGEDETGNSRSDYHSVELFKRRRDRAAMIRTALNWVAEDPNLVDSGKRTTPEIKREAVENRSAAESTVRDGEKPTSISRRAIEIEEHIEREAEDFNITIGSISLTVEEPKKETKVVQSPPSRPVERPGPPDISTRLSRHYIKVR